MFLCFLSASATNDLTVQTSRMMLCSHRFSTMSGNTSSIYLIGTHGKTISAWHAFFSACLPVLLVDMCTSTSGACVSHKLWINFPNWPYHTIPIDCIMCFCYISMDKYHTVHILCYAINMWLCDMFVRLDLAFSVYIEIVIGTLYVGSHRSMLRDLVDDIINRYYGPLTAILAWVILFLVTVATREYINFTTIEANITYQQEQQEYRQEKIDFEQNFLIPYLDSSSALFFYQHENSILWPREYIIHIERPEPTKEASVTDPSTIQNTQQARQDFFERIWIYIQNH